MRTRKSCRALTLILPPRLCRQQMRAVLFTALVVLAIGVCVAVASEERAVDVALRGPLRT